MRVETREVDYVNMGLPTQTIKQADTSLVSDTGSQSCLWGLEDFYRCGYKKADLIPVKQKMYAANRQPINIEGAILVRLSGKDKNGVVVVALVMVYVSRDTKHFYVSKQALIALHVIPSDFPTIGGARDAPGVAACGDDVSETRENCGCPTREDPPPRPE